MRLEKDSHSSPVGLIAVSRLIAETPERRDDILAYEIRRRERELLITRETRHALSWHPFHTTKVVFAVGGGVFVIVWLMSQLRAVAEWYTRARAATLTIPLPLIGDRTIDLGSHVPTSTAFDLMGRLPQWGLLESFWIAVGLMLVIVLERIIFAAFQWKHVQALASAETELAEEIATLRAWQKSQD